MGTAILITQKFVLFLISRDTIYAMGSQIYLLIFRKFSEACLLYKDLPRKIRGNRRHGFFKTVI